MHCPTAVGEGPAGETTPEPSPTQAFNHVQALRNQAQEILAEILADTTPEQAGTRDRLLACIGKHPGRPETALLEHLMKRPAAPHPGTERPAN